MASEAENERDREHAIDEAFADYLGLVDRGECPELETFLRQHADISDELRELISTASTVRAMADGAASHRSSEMSGSHPTLPLESSITSMSTESEELAQAFGEYELKDELGRGGMGVVYKARQTSMNRDVALKMIINRGYSSEDSIRRFYQEAKAAGQLAHRNIVRAYTAGEHDGQHYFSMELIEGRNLRQIVAHNDEQMPTKTIARYMKAIAEGVQFAHERGIVHRDLKPANVIVDDNDVPKIADFGLAKDLNPEDSFETASGSVVGTPSYMAPEQAASRRDQIGPRTDIYSLGAILYDLLTGQPPFKEDTPVGTLMLVINKEVDPPSDINPDCHRDLEAICMKCLEKKPSDRYGSSAELAEEFDRVLEGVPVHARQLTQLQRAKHWLRGLPMVAYASGRNPAYATKSQRRAQWAFLIVLFAGVAAFLSRASLREGYDLQRIELGVGEADGEYERIGNLIRERLGLAEQQIVNTAGSVASREKLLAHQLDLCIMQHNTMQSAEVSIVAPLFPEAILILVRKSSGIDSLLALNGRSIALGAPDSGVYATSSQLLQSLGISTNAESRERSWTELAKDVSLDGAIVTVSPRDKRLADLVRSGDFQILPLTIDDLPGQFELHRFGQAEFPVGAGIGPNGLVTGAAQAVLAVRRSAPDWLVSMCLERIYDQEGVALSGEAVPLEEAFAWSAAKSLHPSASAFFGARIASPKAD